MNEKIEKKIYSKPKVLNMNSIGESIGACLAGSGESGSCMNGAAPTGDCNSGSAVSS